MDGYQLFASIFRRAHQNKHAGDSVNARISPDPNFFAGSEAWETPVSLHLHDVELGAVFDRLKFNLPDDTTLEQQDGRLVIAKRPSPALISRAYDLHDLVGRWETSAYFSAVSGGGIGGSGATSAVTVPSRRDDILAAVRMLIESKINNEDSQYGNRASTITPVASTLYITAPEAIHEKIDLVLRHLRDAESLDDSVAARGKAK